MVWHLSTRSSSFYFLYLISISTCPYISQSSLTMYCSFHNILWDSIRIGKEHRLKECGKLLYNDMYFIGPTGTPVFLDKCKIDDIFVIGEAETTPAYVSLPQSHTKSTADPHMWDGIYVY